MFPQKQSHRAVFPRKQGPGRRKRCRDSCFLIKRFISRLLHEINTSISSKQAETPGIVILKGLLIYLGLAAPLRHRPGGACHYADGDGVIRRYRGPALSVLPSPPPAAAARQAFYDCGPFCVSMPKVYLRGDTLRISVREVDSFSQTTRKCINIEMKNFRRE